MRQTYVTNPLDFRLISLCTQTKIYVCLVTTEKTKGGI